MDDDKIQSFMQEHGGDWRDKSDLTNLVVYERDKSDQPEQYYHLY